MNYMLLAAFTTGIVFYLLIPGGGAFYVRRRWRLFRSRVIGSTLLPRVSYAKVKNTSEGYIGEFRMLGSLQAIQGDDTIWISNESVSLRVDLTGVDVYTLPHSELTSRDRNISINDKFTDEIPVRMAWNRFFSLPEGTRLYVSGSLYREAGQLLFKTSRDYPLMVLIYDGNEDTILLRTIWAGRQQNEYMNDFTPGSLAAGAVLILLFAYISVRQTGMEETAWLIFTMAITPLLALLPPGLVFFELYRYFWKRGRRFRAERDLALLPLRYWSKGSGLSECRDFILPWGQVYGYRCFESVKSSMELVPKARMININPGGGNENKGAVCVFGVVSVEGGGEPIIPSRDLLVSPLIYPGDPRELSVHCARRARLMEISSGLALVAGLGLNLLLFILFLRYFVS